MNRRPHCQQIALLTRRVHLAIDTKSAKLRNTGPAASSAKGVNLIMLTQSLFAHYFHSVVSPKVVYFHVDNFFADLNK